MPKSETSDILVIGAGLAGLTAAFCLQQAGRQVRVLEGAARIGGRIRSVQSAQDQRPVADLGPTWVWPKWQPVMSRWMDRLSLQALDQYETGDGLLDGFGPAPYRQDLPGQDGISRLVDGPSAFIGALFDRLEPETVTLNTKAVAIAPAAAGLCVRTQTGADITATHIILAAPLRLVAEHLRIAGLPAQVVQTLQDTPTWMAQQAKAVALYSDPFWRSEGLSGRVASHRGPLVEIHDHAPASSTMGALFGFVGWQAQDRAADPEGLRAAILSQLARCFGDKAAAPDDLILQDWASEPLICSALDLARPPVLPEVGPDLLRAGHLGNRLWLAVSETSSISPGLIEGALHAGETTAERVLKCLRD